MADFGSATRFATDAEAIVQAAPDVQRGIDELKDEYLKYEWDKPEIAAQALSDAASRIRQKFSANEDLDEATAAKVAPYPLSEFPEGPDQVSNWEQKNLEYLSKTTDPDYLIFKDQIVPGVSQAAQTLRRGERFSGETTGSLGNAIKSTALDVLDVGARAVLGATGGALDLVGAKSVKSAIEQYTDPAYDNDATGVIAQGLGQFEAAVGIGAAYGVGGTYAYLAAQGAGSVREQYEDTKHVTGDTTLALETAGVEAVNQGLQAVVGAKIFGKAGVALAEGAERAAGAVLGESIAPSLVGAAKEGFTEYAGSLVSAKTKKYGRNQDTTLTKEDYSSAALEGMAGFVFGGAGEFATQFAARSKTLNPDPKETQDNVDYTTGDAKPIRTVNQSAPVHTELTQELVETGKTVDPEQVVETEGGTKFIFSSEGPVLRQGADGTVYQALDGTFAVEGPVAQRILELQQDPTVRILEDDGKLYVSARDLNPDLTSSETPKARNTYEIPTSPTPIKGGAIIQANKPKNINGNNVQEAVYVSPPIKEVGGSVGAMKRVGESDPKMGGRFRNMEGFTPEFRMALEQKDYQYVEFSFENIQQSAQSQIKNQGVEEVVKSILDPANDLQDPYDIALLPPLMDSYTAGIEKAISAGDHDAAARLAETQAAIADKAIKSSTGAAQTLRAFSLISKIDPSLRLRKVRDYWVRNTAEVVAKEFGVSPRQVQNIQQEVTAAEDEVKTLTKGIEAEENTVDKTLKDVDNNIKILEQQPAEDLEAFQKQEQEIINQHQAEIEDLKAQDETKAEEADAQVEKAVSEVEKELFDLTKKHQDDVKALQEKLDTATEEAATFEKKLQEKAKAAKQVENQKQADAIERNKKTLTPEQLAKLQEGAKLAREAKPKISKEDAKTLKELKRKEENAKRAVENEQVEFDNKKEKLEPLIKQAKSAPKAPKTTDKTAKKIKDLQEQIRLREQRLAAAKPEDFQKKGNVKKIEKLKADRKYIIENRDKLRDQKISPQQREALKLAETKRDRVRKIRDKFEERLAKRLKNFTPEKQAKLTELFRLARTLSGSSQQQVVTAAAQLEQEIFNENGIPELDRPFYTFWILNNLSGPGTQAKNVFGNFTQTLGDFIGVTFSQGAPGAKAFFNGILTGLSQAPDVIASEWAGQHVFKPRVDTKGELIDTGELALNKDYSATVLKNGGPDFVTAKLPKVLAPLRLLGYVGRLLRAADAAFFVSNREAMARVIATKKGRAEGQRGAALRSYVSQQLSGSTTAASDAMVRAKADVAAMQAAGINFGGLDTERATRLRAMEILEADRPKDVREFSNDLAQQATLTNKPEGIIGQIAAAVQLIGRAPITINGTTIRPLQFFTAFTNVAANIANRSLDFTPVGAARSLSLYSDRTALERQIVFGKFLFGSAGLSVLFAAARGFLDKDDPYFAIFADGPRDFNARKQWKDAGGKAYSFKFGDKYIDYSNTAIAMPLAALGGYFDVQRSNRIAGIKGNKQDDSTMFALIIASMGKNFTDQSFMRTLGDTVRAIQGEPGYDAVNVLAINPARGFLPAKGLLTSVGRWFENPIETKGDYWSKFISGYPIVDKIGTRPALNAFGEEVAPTFVQRMDVLSSFFSERSTDPAWRWLAVNGYTIPTPKADITFKNSEAPESRVAKLGAIQAGRLQQDEAYELAKTAGPEIKQIVLNYQTQYGIAAFDPKVQERLNGEINKVINRVKADIATR